MNRLSETYQQLITVLPVTLKTVEPVYDKAHVTINRSAIPISSYYSYGMEMPGRTFTAQSYRYGYQGSEQAPEYKQAGGNVYTTFFRTLDSRLGRWSTPDVVSQPWQSPYCSMDNNPVALVDLWGASAGKPPKGVPEAKCPQITTGANSEALDMKASTNITQSFSQYAVSMQTEIINKEVAKKEFQKAITSAEEYGEASGEEFTLSSQFIENQDDATVEWDVELTIQNKEDEGIEDLTMDVERSKPPGEEYDKYKDFVSGAGLTTTMVSQAASNAAHDLEKNKICCERTEFSKTSEKIIKVCF